MRRFILPFLVSRGSYKFAVAVLIIWLFFLLTVLVYSAKPDRQKTVVFEQDWSGQARLSEIANPASRRVVKPEELAIIKPVGNDNQNVIIPLPPSASPEHSIVVLPVPFMVQAPYANWGLPYQEACEEAAMIMAAKYFKGNKDLRLGAAASDRAILQLVEWQKKERGFYEDTTAAQVAEIMADYFNLKAVVAPYNAAVIRQEIRDGKLVLLPVAGRHLGNPYFRRPGPLYHMLVIKGFAGDEFITNDPGTKRGESYRYAEAVLRQAAHDWNDGKVETGEAVMIIVSEK